MLRNMKTLKSLLVIITMALTTWGFSSCDDDGYSLGKIWIGMATVNPTTDNKNFYLTLDDGTKLWPAATNYPGYEPEEDQRAVVWFTILSDSIQGYDHFIKLVSIENVLTKPIAEDLGEKNDSVYGKDPVQIESDNIWIGDGYLNFEFGFNYGGEKKHFINLVKDSNADSPYKLHFRHNAYDDPAREGVKGLAAFNLSSLPDTEGKDVTLVISVETFKGPKEFTLTYNSSRVEEAKVRSFSSGSGQGIK